MQKCHNGTPGPQVNRRTFLGVWGKGMGTLGRRGAASLTRG